MGPCAPLPPEPQRMRKKPAGAADMVFIQGSADEDEDGMAGEGQMAGITPCAERKKGG